MSKFSQDYHNSKVQYEADAYNHEHNSIVRHPVKKVKGYKNAISSATHKYWKQGQQRLDSTPKYYSDKYVAQYAWHHTGRWTKFFYALLILLVVFFIIWGALN